MRFFEVMSSYIIVIEDKSAIQFYFHFVGIAFINVVCSV